MKSILHEERIHQGRMNNESVEFQGFPSEFLDQRLNHTGEGLLLMKGSGRTKLAADNSDSALKSESLSGLLQSVRIISFVYI